MRYLLDTCMLVALLQRELGSERIREKILLSPSGSLAEVIVPPPVPPT